MYSIIAGLGADLTTLAQQGGAAYRDRFELVYRRESAHSNDVWQADHTRAGQTVGGYAAWSCRAVWVKPGYQRR